MRTDRGHRSCTEVRPLHGYRSAREKGNSFVRPSQMFSMECLASLLRYDNSSVTKHTTMKHHWKNIIITGLWILWIIWAVYAIIKIRPTWLAMTMITFMFLSTFFITVSITITDNFGDK